MLGFELMGFFLGCSCVKACSVVVAGKIPACEYLSTVVGREHRLGTGSSSCGLNRSKSGFLG